MKTNLYRLLTVLFLFPVLALAQTTVNGTVTEATSSQPLPSVNVIVKGTSQGTATDFDGNFSINVNSGDVLVISYVGFITQEIAYNGQSTINVLLEEDAALLDEIVVIGYGSTTKQDATGAVEKVSSEEFNKGAIVAPEQLLAGKSAGVRVTSSGGAPGSGSEIRIRGGASLSANNSPLIVIDGLPIDQRGGSQGTRNALNSINPNEIEDFVVLKDASATAIYGSRASNGVILITTKKGKTNAPLTVEYDLKASVQSVTDFVDVLSAREFRNYVEESGEDTSLLGNSNTNWQDEIYETAVGAIHNLTVSKGYENFSFRANLNHVSQQGVLIGDLYERNAINLSFVKRLLDNDLKLTLTTKGILDENSFADNGAIGSAVAFDPTQPVFNDDGSYFQYLGESQAPVNPLFLLEQNQNRAKSKRNITNLNIDYRLWFMKDLRFVINAGYDYAENDGKQFNPPTPTNADSFRYQNFYDGLNRNTLLDTYFNYKKDVSVFNTNTDIDITLGHSFQEFYIRSDQRETGPEGSLVTNPTTIERNALESYFARASFDINDKYLLSASFRRDGSSRFSEDNRWGNFPSLSVGWKISNEEFMQNSFFSSLKLRAGWGITGQQEVGPNYGYLGVYSPSLPTVQVPFGGTPIATLRPEEFDEGLKWEETTQYNIALDFGFFNDRLTGTIDGYYRETDDLLATVPPPAGTNLSDQVLTNVGSTLSKGLELGLNGSLIKTDDVNWNLGFNFTLQENKITDLSLGDDPNFAIPREGISGGTGNTIQLWREGLDPSTFFVYRQVYDDNGNAIEGAYVDINGDNQITTDDRQAYKKAAPDAFLGFTNNLRYKNLDFNFTFRGSLGNYVYNNVASDRGNSTVLTTPGNFLTNAHNSVLETGFLDDQLLSDRYIERADFIRLDNISVGYLIPGEKVDFRASLTATNVFVITEYDGLDPEISNGVDNNFYPRARTFVLGLNVTF